VNASNDVSQSAMYGTNDELINEVKNSSPNYYRYYTAPVSMAPGSTEFMVNANIRYPTIIN